MKVKWPNVVMFALLLVALVIGFRNRQEIDLFLSGIEHAGPYHQQPSDAFHGLVALSFVTVILFGLLRMLFNSERED